MAVKSGEWSFVICAGAAQNYLEMFEIRRRPQLSIPAAINDRSHSSRAWSLIGAAPHRARTILSILARTQDAEGHFL
jgi:hypothetical protein